MDIIVELNFFLCKTIMCYVEAWLDSILLGFFLCSRELCLSSKW